MASDQSAVIAFLSDPQTHGGRPVERLDTHGAVVFLVGDDAYKLKRAVAFAYMDFSTVARREAACRRELALNGPTAPEIYRGVVPVCRDARGRLSLGGDGQAVDWVVQMRRFPQEAMLSALAAHGGLTAGIVEALADEVVAFHARAQHHPEVGAQQFRWVVEENIEEFRAKPEVFSPSQVAVLETRARAALDRCIGLLDERAAGGFVRHCHGDLHLQNVVMIDGRPVLFDAIEFNDAIARVDVWYDWAFLLMDLDDRGLADLANRGFNRYLDLSGDDGALACLPLFLSTRAAVRAKVGASAAAAQQGDAADALVTQARGYLDWAVRYLTRHDPRLIAVGGLSGTGKTTVARALAQQVEAPPGAVIVRSDVIRKRQFGVQPETRLPAEAYTPEATRQVYAEMCRRADSALRAGWTVIADAVHADPAERHAIAAVAQRRAVPFTGLWLEAPQAVLEARVDGRAGDASDADRAVVGTQSTYRIGPMDWTVLPAGGPVETVLHKARSVLASFA